MVSIKSTHLAGDIGDPQEVEQGQQEAIEHRQDVRGLSLAHLTVVFTQGSHRTDSGGGSQLLQIKQQHLIGK